MASTRLGSTRVTWQGGVLLSSLLVMACTIFLLAFLTSQPDQRGNDGVKTFCWITILITLALSGLAIWRRLAPARDHKERMTIIIKLAVGLGATLVAVVVTFLSQDYGAFSILGQHWYFLPSGLYLAALAIVANAMNPDIGKQVSNRRPVPGNFVTEKTQRGRR